MNYEKNWLKITEFLSITGSIAGTVLAVIYQQVVYAATPISLSLLLSWMNRHHFERRTEEKLERTVTHLQQQLFNLDLEKQQWSKALTSVIERLEMEAQTVASPSNLQLVYTDLEHFKNQQITLENQIKSLQIQLESLSNQFKHRPELEQIESLTKIIITLQKYLDQLPAATLSYGQVVDIQKQVERALASIPEQVKAAGQNLLEEINRKLQLIDNPHDYELVMAQENSRSLLLEAMDLVQERLFVASPWLRRTQLDEILLQKLRQLLQRQCYIDIAWDEIEAGSAFESLQQLQCEYPQQITLKRLPNHENFLVCDHVFAWVGSHDVLGADQAGSGMEVGIRTSDPQIIEELTQHFAGAPTLKL
jgi:hypothetical protein